MHRPASWLCFPIVLSRMSWKEKLFTWKSAFLITGFLASMSGASIFARRIPQVISFNKKEVMEKRRQERELLELKEKVKQLEQRDAKSNVS